MVRIGLQTWGTEGDVRPFFALAGALRTRGHEVELVYTNVEARDFGPLAARVGVTATSVGADYFRRNAARNAKRAQESFDTGNPLRQVELIVEDLLDPVVDEMYEAGRALAARSDVMVGHFLAYPSGTAAEVSGVPYGIVSLQPIFASRHYPPVGLPNLGPLNGLGWKIAAWVLERTFRDRVNALRTRVGLAAIRGIHRAALDRSVAALVAVSPALFPRPPDWEERIDVTGFLGLPETAEPWEPEPELRTFLDAGAPPAFLSFGSMFNLDGDRTLGVVTTLAEAVKLAGTRGVIQAPEAVIARAPRHEAIAYIARAPHAQLFPRCSMIVHHGGAGTTQSALLAGRPSIVVPHAADQFYWGDVLRSRGVATKSLGAKSLAAKPLAERIRQVLAAPEMTERAKGIGDALRLEDGPARAAEMIERRFSAHRA